MSGEWKSRWSTSSLISTSGVKQSCLTFPVQFIGSGSHHPCPFHDNHHLFSLHESHHQTLLPWYQACHFAYFYARWKDIWKRSSISTSFSRMKLSLASSVRLQLWLISNAWKAWLALNWNGRRDCCWMLTQCGNWRSFMPSTFYVKQIRNFSGLLI